MHIGKCRTKLSKVELVWVELRETTQIELQHIFSQQINIRTVLCYIAATDRDV